MEPGQHLLLHPASPTVCPANAPAKDCASSKTARGESRLLWGCVEVFPAN